MWRKRISKEGTEELRGEAREEKRKDCKGRDMEERKAGGTSRTLCSLLPRGKGDWGGAGHHRGVGGEEGACGGEAASGRPRLPLDACSPSLPPSPSGLGAELDLPARRPTWASSVSQRTLANQLLACFSLPCLAPPSPCPVLRTHSHWIPGSGWCSSVTKSP